MVVGPNWVAEVGRVSRIGRVRLAGAGSEPALSAGLTLGAEVTDLSVEPLATGVAGDGTGGQVLGGVLDGLHGGSRFCLVGLSD